MAKYIHELKEWPELTWLPERLGDLLAAVRHRQGILQGRVQAVGFSIKQEAVLQTLTADVVNSSAIEGEELDRDDVRSSIARRLGIEIGGLRPADRGVEGVVEMMLDATQNFEAPLTADRLWGWHAALFPTGRSGMSKIRVGAWRDDKSGPMQIVSGPIGRETVHYQAPAAELLETEMGGFLRWYETADLDPVLKAGVAHFRFVTIHPFDDGNGRIARAIADQALARSENSSQRFYSMSSSIQEERNDYYDVLESTQKGNLDISDWLEWFLNCLDRAIVGAEAELADVFKCARFWEINQDVPFNERQRSVLNRFLSGFVGKLTTSKWAKLANCSPDTALRDIDELIRLRILMKDPGGGRSTSYSLDEALIARLK